MFRRDVWLRTSSGEIVNYKHFDDKNKLLVGVNRYKLDANGRSSLEIARNQTLRYRNGGSFKTPVRVGNSISKESPAASPYGS